MEFKSLIICILSIFLVQASFAQSAEGVALGIQIGQPSGLSVLAPGSKFDTDILLAWDLGDFFYANVHGLLRSPVKSKENISLFYGPGIYAGFRERGNQFDPDDIFLGISGTIGLRLIIESFEIYARITPRLQLIDATSGDIGGGLGFRYFL